MEKLYSTGEFAKIAGVTIRTIRYYDKIGLLKPTKVLNNGYRRYCNNDLITLQKIVSLKQLGFSLEEIYPLIQESASGPFSYRFPEPLTGFSHHLKELQSEVHLQ